MVRPGSGRFEVGFWVGFRVGLRARDFPPERVLSRTPLIIRTVVWAAAMGRRRRAAGTRTGRGRTFIARCSGRSRGAGTRRWTACSTARRRRMWATRNTAARWMIPPTTPALLTLGTPPVSEERSGAHPAAAPKLSL